MSTQHKKLLPQGTPPPQRSGPPPTGQRQVLRVNRACNSCRRQKMRCEAPGNPPCNRCRASGIQCIFSQATKPEQLDAASSQRLRDLETQVTDIKGNQSQMQVMLQDILSELRNNRPRSEQSQGSSPFPARYSPPRIYHNGPSSSSGSFTSRPDFPPFRSPSRNLRLPSPLSSINYSRSPTETPRFDHNFNTLLPASNHTHNGGANRAILPPIQSIISYNQPQRFQESSYPTPHSFGSGAENSPKIPCHNYPHLSTDFHSNPFPHIGSPRSPADPHHNLPPHRPPSRHFPAQVYPMPPATLLPDNFAPLDTPPTLVHATDSWLKPSARDTSYKKRKRGHTWGHESRFSRERDNNRSPWNIRTLSTDENDVVGSGIISEADARALFALYFASCHRLLAVFDPRTDTFESMKSRCPFCFCCILMVASKVRDGCGQLSATQKLLQLEVTEQIREKMFQSVPGIEVVQGMLLLATCAPTTGFTAWAVAGYAIRCAAELGLHTAIPRLRQNMKRGQANCNTDKALIAAARTWCALFIFEHQLSFGAGRPSMIGDEKGIPFARQVLLPHPLALSTDARLVSTCELLIKQRRIYEALSPLDEPLDDHSMCGVLQEARSSINDWHSEWNTIMSNDHHPCTGFLRIYVAIQRSYAHTFYLSMAMRNLRSKAEAKATLPEMREVALTAIASAKDCIDIFLNNAEYRNELKFAVSYSHMCAAFAGAFLLRMSRLFVDDGDLASSQAIVEDLAAELNQASSSRFSHLLNNMLSHNYPGQSFSGSLSPTSIPQLPNTPTFSNDFVQILHPTSPPVTNPPDHPSQAEILHPVAIDEVNFSWKMPDYQLTGDLIAPFGVIQAEFSWDVII